jgi:hypothetical protein
MPFNETDYRTMLESYAEECIELELQRWTGPDDGVNVDVGEIYDFNLSVTNNGDLGVLNAVVGIQARHGMLSQSYWGFLGLAGEHWMGPWLPSIIVRPFDLDPNSTYTHTHESSGGRLFAFRADEPTGGTDNNRDVEDLVTATLVMWQPNLQKLYLRSGGPTDTWSDFIQRS